MEATISPAILSKYRTSSSIIHFEIPISDAFINSKESISNAFFTVIFVTLHAEHETHWL